MANEREIGILISMRNQASGELRKVERDLAQFKSKVTSTFSFARATMMGVWSGAIFGGLLQASKELNDEWRKFKEEVMAAGPTDSLRVLGSSIADLVTGLKDSNSQAKTLGEHISTIIDTLSLVPIGLQAMLDRLRMTGGLLKERIIRGNAAVFQLIDADAAEQIDQEADRYRDAVDAAKAAEEGGYSPAGNLARRREELQNALDDQRAGARGLQQPVIPISEIISGMDAINGRYKNLEEANRAVNEQNNRRYEDMRKTWDSIADANAEINEGLDEQSRLIADIYHTAHDYYNVMANEVLEAYDDLIEGKVKPLDQYMKDIVAQWGRMAAQAAMETAFQVGTKIVASAFMAGGGITRGGIGLPSYADGTVVSGPRPAMIGDNPERMEAVIPMRNRKVPVEITGGGGGTTENTTIVINAVDGESVRRMLFGNREALRGAIRMLKRENPNI